MKQLLRRAGLRPTQQRMALGELLFGKGDRHITAEMLYQEATEAKVPVSLATVYNTLNQFKEVRMVRQLGLDGSKAFFCTSTEMHHHFFVEDENRVLDIADQNLALDKIPTPPQGYEITHIDIAVRLRRKKQ
jgi:Fur family iron response transcriptional regulator